MARKSVRREAGFTMLVGMMMLFVLTLLVLSGIRTGMTNSRIVGNMQFRDEATYAAQWAIDRTIEGTLFSTNPAAVEAALVSVDINGDAVADYSVSMTPRPACVAYKVLKYSELAMPQDSNCTEGVGAAASGASTFVAGGFGQKDSLCANTHWRITAHATNPFTGSSVDVVQGVSVRVDTKDAQAFCAS